MTFTIEKGIGFSKILEVVNNSGEIVYRNEDIQEVLNFQVFKGFDNMKKKKGKYHGKLSKDDIKYLGIIQ